MKMNRDKWQKAKEIFDAALKLDPNGREQFLAEASAGDEELHREVESLLANSDENISFLEKPAVGEVAEIIINQKETGRINQIFGRYKILKLIGAGGMGEVYLAQDIKLHRKVALKLLPENIIADNERLRRFEQEAFAASGLNHPNILTIYEFGEENGVHYLAAEFVEGETLRERLQGGELTIKESVAILEQIAFALSAASMPPELFTVISNRKT
jgi:serine/threonine protein kinase